MKLSCFSDPKNIFAGLNNFLFPFFFFFIYTQTSIYIMAEEEVDIYGDYEFGLVIKTNQVERANYSCYL